MELMGCWNAGKEPAIFLCGNINREVSGRFGCAFLLLHETDMEDICRFRHGVEDGV